MFLSSDFSWLLALMGILLLVRVSMARLIKSKLSRATRTDTIKTALYIGETKHVRFMPIVHKFVYPVLYYGIDLDDNPQTKNSIFSIFGTDILSLCPSDFLNCGANTLDDVKSAAMFHLQQAGFGNVDSIHLITMPKIFGYSFNPVNFYLCYDNQHTFVALLLEVSNTFDEGHVYIVSPHSTSVIYRAFHVSPFNDISGTYDISCTVPSEITDYFHVNILYKTPDDKKKFYAFAHLKPYSVNIWSLLYILFEYPFTLYLTVPRIFWEAGKLAYVKHLNIYPKPAPKSQATIKQIPPSSLEVHCMDIIFGYLHSHLEDFDSPYCLCFNLPSGESKKFKFKPLRADLNINLTNYDFFFWLVCLSNGRDALMITLQDCSWSSDSESVVIDLLSDAFANDREKKGDWCRMTINHLLFTHETQNFRSTIDNYVDKQENSLQIKWKLVYYSFNLFLHFKIFNLITPWAKGHEPATWSRQENYLFSKGRHNGQEMN